MNMIASIRCECMGSLVDGNFERLQEDPLHAVVEVESHEEGEDEHDEHAPELATSPLRQTHLRQQHARHVLHLLAALARQTALVAEHLPTQIRNLYKENLREVLELNCESLGLDGEGVLVQLLDVRQLLPFASFVENVRLRNEREHLAVVLVHRVVLVFLKIVHFYFLHTVRTVYLSY